MPSSVSVPDPGASARSERRGELRVDRRGPLKPGPSPRPPLVILGGMTQTLSSWGGQIRSLAAEREVVVYEARGQGQTTLSLDDVRPPVHVADFVHLLEALELAGPVDLCGFSFGGRLALAIAAAYPAKIRRLVITGVSAGRGALGRVIVRGWRETLRTGDLEALAWVSLPEIVGPAFLERSAHLIEPMIKATVQRNTYAGIAALFAATLDDETDAPDGEPSPFAPLRLAPAIAAPTLLIAGALDRLAPAADLQALAAAFPQPAKVAILPEVGHTAAIEAPEAWRRAVLDFLDAEEPIP